MKKIVVRDKILERGQANSSYIYLCNDTDYSSLEYFLRDYNYKLALEKIFGEEINSELLEDSSLYELYKLALESQQDNDYFKILYKISDEFAVHLTENIYLYHLIPKKGEIYSSITPWFYADSKKYFGDTWWENDSVIINDLINHSVVEFLEKYKGY